MRNPWASLGLILAACGGAVQKPAPQHDFDDSAVQQRCECAPPRKLSDTEPVGDVTVAQQRSALSRSWQTALHWHPQAWFDVPAVASRVTVGLRAKDAYVVTCTEASQELGCFSGNTLDAELTLTSEDHWLAETFTVQLRFVPEPIVHRGVALPAALQAHRKQTSAPGLMLSVQFDGDGHGQLYVDGASQAGEVSEQPIATWDLAEPGARPVSGDVP